MIFNKILIISILLLSLFFFCSTVQSDYIYYPQINAIDEQNQAIHDFTYEIDGTLLGLGPKKFPITLGVHQIKITKDGYIPWIGTDVFYDLKSSSHGSRNYLLSDEKSGAKNSRDSDYQSLMNIVNNYELIGDYENALNSINELLSFFTDSGEAYGEKGYILLNLNQFSESIIYSEQAISLNENSSFVWNNIGLAHEKSGKCDDAIRAYKNALKIDPYYQPAKRNKDNFVCPKISGASPVPTITIMPSRNVNDWIEKGNNLLDIGKYQEALAAYEEALLLDSSYTDAWTGKGRALNELKRYKEALDALNNALSLDPEFVSAWNNKGNAFWGLKKYQDAYSSYQKAIQLNPSFITAKENLELLMSEHSSEINQNPIGNSSTITLDISSEVQTSSNAALEMTVINQDGKFNNLDNMYDYSVQIIFKNVGGKPAQEISVYIKDLNEKEILDQYSISMIEPGKEYPDDPAVHTFTTTQKGFLVSASFYDSEDSKKNGNKLTVTKRYG